MLLAQLYSDGQVRLISQRRFLKVTISQFMLIDLMRKGWHACTVVKNPLPEDAFIYKAEVDAAYVVLTVCSAAFDPVDANAGIPDAPETIFRAI